MFISAKDMSVSGWKSQYLNLTIAVEISFKLKRKLALTTGVVERDITIIRITVDTKVRIIVDLNTRKLLTNLRSAS